MSASQSSLASRDLYHRNNNNNNNNDGTFDFASGEADFVISDTTVDLASGGGTLLFKSILSWTGCVLQRVVDSW